jgi:LytR_cpsA_psr family
MSSRRRRNLLRAGFLDVVNALGGITLCNRSGHRLDDRYANLHMAPGCQEMNGVRALAFARARHVDSEWPPTTSGPTTPCARPRPSPWPWCSPSGPGSGPISCG